MVDVGIGCGNKDAVTVMDADVKINIKILIWRFYSA